MRIKNLAQLKRVIQEKKEFIIRAHRHEKFLGQKRVPNIVQSNGFYSVISGQPDVYKRQLLHLFRFWYDRNRYKSWKLQIAA